MWRGLCIPATTTTILAFPFFVNCSQNFSITGLYFLATRIGINKTFLNWALPVFDKLPLSFSRRFPIAVQKALVQQKQWLLSHSQKFSHIEQLRENRNSCFPTHTRNCFQQGYFFPNSSLSLKRAFVCSSTSFIFLSTELPAIRRDSHMTVPFWNVNYSEIKIIASNTKKSISYE